MFQKKKSETKTGRWPVGVEDIIFWRALCKYQGKVCDKYVRCISSSFKYILESFSLKKRKSTFISLLKMKNFLLTYKQNFL